MFVRDSLPHKLPAYWCEVETDSASPYSDLNWHIQKRPLEIQKGFQLPDLPKKEVSKDILLFFIIICFYFFDTPFNGLFVRHPAF